MCTSQHSMLCSRDLLLFSLASGSPSLVRLLVLALARHDARTTGTIHIRTWYAWADRRSGVARCADHTPEERVTWSDVGDDGVFRVDELVVKCQWRLAELQSDWHRTGSQHWRCLADDRRSCDPLRTAHANRLSLTSRLTATAPVCMTASLPRQPG